MINVLRRTTKKFSLEDVKTNTSETVSLQNGQKLTENQQKTVNFVRRLEQEGSEGAGVVHGVGIGKTGCCLALVYLASQEGGDSCATSLATLPKLCTAHKHLETLRTASPLLCRVPKPHKTPHKSGSAGPESFSDSSPPYSTVLHK